MACFEARDLSGSIVGDSHHVTTFVLFHLFDNIGCCGFGNLPKTKLYQVLRGPMHEHKHMEELDGATFVTFYGNTVAAHGG